MPTRPRDRRPLTRLAALLLAAAAAGFLVAGCGSPRRTASVGSTLAVAPGGSDDAACSVESPCRSFGRAYELATRGQVVEVEAGSYPAQEIAADPARTTEDDVVFRPAAGASPTIGAVSIRGSHVELRDLTVAGVTTYGSASDVTLRDLTNTAGLFVLSSTRVRVLGGSIGPGVDYHPMIAAEDGSVTPPTDVVIDGVLFHDWTRSGPSIHTECLQVGAGAGVAVRNSRFRNCAVMDLYVTHFGAAPEPRDVTIENDFFDTAADGGYYSLETGAYENLLIRNNSFAQSFVVFTDRGPNVGVQVVGNVGPLAAWGCAQGVTYRYNVWDGVRCGPTDVDAPSGFVDAPAGDLHLAPGAAAIGRGDPESHPPTDIDGQARPDGGPPDAGADQTIG